MSRSSRTRLRNSPLTVQLQTRAPNGRDVLVGTFYILYFKQGKLYCLRGTYLLSLACLLLNIVIWLFLPCRSTSRAPSHERCNARIRQEAAARDIIIVVELNHDSEGRQGGGGGTPHKLLQAGCPNSGKGKETQPRHFTKSVQQSILGKRQILICLDLMFHVVKNVCSFRRIRRTIKRPFLTQPTWPTYRRPLRISLWLHASLGHQNRSRGTWQGHSLNESTM